MRVIPVTHAQANNFVRQYHRHSRPTLGAIFCVGVGEPEHLHGVAICGRPVARHLDDGQTIEILRVCVKDRHNACSMLYGACRRVAKELGYQRVITYTLPEEGGASLRAAGFMFDGNAGGPAKRWHNRPKRTAQQIGDDLVGGKWRWSAELRARQPEC